VSEETWRALERQADALEELVEETRYQNAVLTELALATHMVAVASNEYARPEELPEHVPSLRGLATNIEDQAFTREEER
jgi:hypothetical protein